eukprot:3035936-Pleurochrysis_carterae.AAC.1
MQRAELKESVSRGLEGRREGGIEGESRGCWGVGRKERERWSGRGSEGLEGKVGERACITLLLSARASIRRVSAQIASSPAVV